MHCMFRSRAITDDVEYHEKQKSPTRRDEMAEDLQAGLIAMPSSKTSVHQARGIGSLKTKIAGREDVKREVEGLCKH